MRHIHQSTLTSLDMRALTVLSLMYETSSVTKTAERMGESQPTVSIWLRRLRKDFGDPLFVKTPQGMVPTLVADSIIDDVHGVLAGLRRIAQAGARFIPRTSSRTFRLFMTDASHITLLPKLFKHLQTHAPLVSVEVSTIQPDLERRMQAGEGDIAIGLVPRLDAGFLQQSLFDQDWICLCRSDHPRLRQRLSIAGYARERHVDIAYGTGHELLASAVASNRIERNVQLRIPGFLGLSGVLSNSELVATIPRYIGQTIAAAAGLKQFDAPFRISPFTVKQYWHSRMDGDEGNRWLRARCSDLFNRETVSAR